MIHGICAFSCCDDALFMYVCNTHDMHTFFGTQTAKISLNGRFTKNDSIKQDPRACVWEHHIVVTNFNNEKPILVITQQAPHQQAHYLHHFFDDANVFSDSGSVSEFGGSGVGFFGTRAGIMKRLHPSGVGFFGA